MTYSSESLIKGLFPLIFILFFSAVSVKAAENKDYQGWETGSTYNKLYQPTTRDTLKGKVNGFSTVVPLPGMSPGTAIIIEEGKNEKTVVHVCPKAYASAKEIGIKKGDTVKIKGNWIEIEGEFLFVAAKIKKGDDFSFKVRKTSDGTPFWTMSPEQIATEKEAQD